MDKTDKTKQRPATDYGSTKPLTFPRKSAMITAVMKRTINNFNSVAGVIAEFAILVGILWGFWVYKELLDFTIIVSLLLLILLSPIFGYLAWKYLRKPNARLLRFKLTFLTFPSLVLCLLLVMDISLDLRAISVAGGPTKEIRSMARKKGVPDEHFSQWANDIIERMKSERIIYLLLLISIGVICDSRCKYLEKATVNRTKNVDVSTGPVT